MARCRHRLPQHQNRNDRCYRQLSEWRAPLGGTDGRHGITSAFEARLDLPSGVIRITEALSRGRRRSGKRAKNYSPDFAIMGMIRFF
jgi:hypothetical protein